MDDIRITPDEIRPELSAADREALAVLGEDGCGLLPDGADMERLEALGLATRLGITWGLTEAGRARLREGA